MTCNSFAWPVTVESAWLMLGFVRSLSERFSKHVHAHTPLQTQINTEQKTGCSGNSSSYDVPGSSDGTAQQHAEDHTEDLPTKETWLISDSSVTQGERLGYKLWSVKAFWWKCTESYAWVSPHHDHTNANPNSSNHVKPSGEDLLNSIWAALEQKHKR